MTIYYAKSTGGFYDSAIHGSAIPGDAIEITQATHDALMAAQSSGKIISADANGNPVATVPIISAAQLWSLYQAGAKAALAESDLTVLRCSENTVAVPVAWATYRKALRAILAASTGDPTQPLPTKPAYPAGT